MARRKSQKRRNKKYQVSNRQLKAKRPYKDTIFRMLYHDKENLLSLYNAVNGRNYTNVEDLQIVTLENAIYMGMKNDLAFIMDMNLYLYEHQSTYNPNIPLRNLFYIADEYQRLVVRKSLYSTVIQKIPTPRFIVFYNGTKKVDDYNEFRLSSAYENPTDDPDLELKEAPKGYIGKYGVMRADYLEQHRKSRYTAMMMTGEINQHMIDIQKQAEERMDELMPELMKIAGATEELKAADQMKWVGLVNNCKQQAEEIIKEEIIYS